MLVYLDDGCSDMLGAKHRAGRPRKPTCMFLHPPERIALLFLPACAPRFACSMLRVGTANGCVRLCSRGTGTGEDMTICLVQSTAQYCTGHSLHGIEKRQWPRGDVEQLGVALGNVGPSPSPPLRHEAACPSADAIHLLVTGPEARGRARRAPATRECGQDPTT